MNTNLQSRLSIMFMLQKHNSHCLHCRNCLDAIAMRTFTHRFNIHMCTYHSHVSQSAQKYLFAATSDARIGPKNVCKCMQICCPQYKITFTLHSSIKRICMAFSTKSTHHLSFVLPAGNMYVLPPFRLYLLAIYAFPDLPTSQLDDSSLYVFASQPQVRLL